MKSEILNMFEKALEKGLRGEVENYSVWLRNRNIEPNKLKLQNIFANFLNNVEIEPKRNDILDTIAEFIGYYLREKSSMFYLPIIGVRGIGKTHICSTLYYALEHINLKLKFIYCDASNFYDDKYYNHIYDNLSENIDVIIMDSCDQYRNILEISKKFSHIINTGIIIGAWTPERYFNNRETISESFIILKEINLQPLNKDDTIKLIFEIINFITINQENENLKTIFNNIIVDYFYEATKGIPNLIINLLYNSLYEAFLKEKDMINEEVIEICINNLGLNLHPTLNNLSDIHLKILKFILESDDNRGLRPLFLREKLDLSKATISYHLTQLIEKKIIEKKKVGKSTFYNIKESLIPFIQIIIEDLREYYG